MYKVNFDSDNLIYNRFDIIYPNNYQKREYEFEDKIYEVLSHDNDGEILLNLWGKELPQRVFDNIITTLLAERECHSVKLNRCKNNYKDYLVETNDIRVPLDENPDDILLRVERRDRATIRRKRRWLDERIGEVSLSIKGKDDIPSEWVNTYFNWKMDSHKTNYRMTPEQYLKKYYVTDAMMLKAGDKEVAVAFWCQCKEAVFFENFSYNPDLRDYSPGLLIYVSLLEELCRRKCKYLYLGGGDYIYKKRFNSEESQSFSGIIYTDEIVERINHYYSNKGIKNVAIYGYGVCGKEFIQISKQLDVNICYAIDKSAIEDGSIRIMKPDDELPETDAIIITLNSHNTEVDEIVARLSKKHTYWIDDRDMVLKDKLEI